jgi:pyridoxal 5'-phosphate synthase pdxS subunit
MAEMLKGGVIMDVVNVEQARIAEDAGAVAVMALERVPADIRAQGGVSRMSDPDMIDAIIAAVSIPVMAKARIGHFVEAQVLQSLGVDYIDESEVLTPADYINHIDKWNFTVPFVCGATNLGEALRRINEGAAMIRSKGEAGTGDVSNATGHMRQIRAEIAKLAALPGGRAVRCGQGTAGPVRTGQGNRGHRQAPGGAVHRRWHRDPGRCCDDDAARRRWRVRWFGYLQIRQPGRARSCRRERNCTYYDDPDVIAKVSAAWAKPWSASTSTTSRSPTASHNAAGKSHLRFGQWQSSACYSPRTVAPK